MIPVCDKCITNNYGKVLFECWKCEVLSLLNDIKERL